jgi:hypothetical protein
LAAIHYNASKDTALCRAGESTVTRERPHAPAGSGPAHGSLMADVHDINASDGEDVDQEDSTEFEKFDGAGGSAGRTRGDAGLGVGASQRRSLDVDHEENDGFYLENDF